MLSDCPRHPNTTKPPRITACCNAVPMLPSPHRPVSQPPPCCCSLSHVAACLELPFTSLLFADSSSPVATAGFLYCFFLLVVLPPAIAVPPLQPTATQLTTCFCCPPSFGDLSAVPTTDPLSSHPIDYLPSLSLLAAGFTSCTAHFSSTAPWPLLILTITWLSPHLLLCLLFRLSPLLV